MDQLNGAAVFPDPDQAPSKELMGTFRRLARSSPWLWDTIELKISEHSLTKNAAGVKAVETSAPLSVLIRRPNAVRVEDQHGNVVFRTDSINDSKSASFLMSNRKSWLLPPKLLAPVYGEDGFVSRRPEAAYVNELMPVSKWNAFLDPVEIAGFTPGPADLAFPHPSIIHTLNQMTDEAGRPCLEADLSRGHSYAPVFTHSPLLAEGTTRLRIDLATGICVQRTVLTGAGAGSVQKVKIIAVDRYMIDGLFTQPTAQLSDVRQAPVWPVSEEKHPPGRHQS
ncbi:hypothetical protein CQ018_13800 [Arthrobacter sp. MYb227]|uniref:hypothetical protein n=1 Tax=Arthrobacter sp. MYb227 TaxID=1848601 RepID=UPI000CFBEF7A|nr:hypothetical protein [Arthrobacter sp. MYb227]PQZ91040.1 hypothetical protein CQ018_13800 [Arthrobacter sp. MYb227]